jgi:predicted MPP superfamily phosphohydrolase
MPLLQSNTFAAMSLRILIPLIFTLAYFGLNIIIYKRLKLWANIKNWPSVRAVFCISVVLVVSGLIVSVYRLITPPVNPSWLVNVYVGFTFSYLLASILFGVVLVLDVIIGAIVRVLFSTKNEYSASRRKFVIGTSTVVAGIPFLSMIQGITFGKYDFQVRNITLKFPDLPEAFDGFKIAQISDIHSGSFDSLSAVKRGIDLVNQQGADIIAFTGDLVNSKSEEVLPFLETYKHLQALHGMYSVKGNHDYGIYYNWPSQEEHIKDQRDMEKHHASIGFKLLNNANQIIERNGQKLALIGVENWGKSPFPQVGDLDLALQGSETTPFTVLLSHDPSHWEEKVLEHPRKIHLTLSGHTHGMQFGVEIPGFKWSPVKYRYPRWAGLYKEQDQYLYVNRGFGFIGFPGRVGIRPEITVFELKTVV